MDDATRWCNWILIESCSPSFNQITLFSIYFTDAYKVKLERRRKDVQPAAISMGTKGALLWFCQLLGTCFSTTFFGFLLIFFPLIHIIYLWEGGERSFYTNRSTNWLGNCRQEQGHCRPLRLLSLSLSSLFSTESHFFLSLFFSPLLAVYLIFEPYTLCSRSWCD